MKKLFAGISVLALIAVAFPLGAATSDTVTATVTAELISVSVSDGTVAYGVLPLDTVQDTVSPNQTQTASNDGNVSIDLKVRSSDATGSTTWELAAARGSDEFTHRFSTNGGVAWTTFNVDNTTYSTLATVATSASQDFDLEIGTPTASTDTVEHSMTVTVQASATP